MGIEQPLLETPRNRERAAIAPLVDETKASAIRTATALGEKAVDFAFEKQGEAIQENLREDIDNIVFEPTSTNQQSLIFSETAAEESLPSELKSFSRKVKALDSAASQGRISAGSRLDRFVSLSRETKNLHPEHSDLIERTISQTLGFNPETERVRRSLASETAEQNKILALEKQLQTLGTERGIVPLNPDGTVDSAEQRRQTLRVLQVEQELKLQNLRTKNETPEARQSLMTGVAIQATLPIWNDQVGSFLTVMGALNATAQEQGQTLDVEQLRPVVSAAADTVISSIRDTMQSQGTPPEVVDAVTQTYREKKEEAMQALDINIETLDNQVKIVQNTLGLEVAESMSFIVKLREAIGETNVAPILKELEFLDETGLRALAKSDFDKLITGEVEKPSQLRSVADLIRMSRGEIGIQDLTHDRANALIKKTMPMLRSMETRANNLNEQDRRVWVNSSMQLLAGGQSTNDPKQIRNASKFFNRPGWINVFKSVESDPNYKDQVEVIADQARSLARRTLVVESPNVVAHPEVQKGRILVEYDIAKGKFEATLSPETNQELKEMTSQRPISTFGVASIAGVRDASLRNVSNELKNVQEGVNVLNNSLDTISEFNKFDTGLKDLSELQVKELIARVQGIPFKPGQTSTLPKNKDHSTEEELVRSSQENFERAIFGVRKSLREVTGRKEEIMQETLQALRRSGVAVQSFIIDANGDLIPDTGE